MKRKSWGIKLLGIALITGVSWATISPVSAQTTSSTGEKKTTESKELSKREKNAKLAITPEIDETDIIAVVGEKGQLTIDMLDFGEDIQIENLMDISIKDEKILTIDEAGKWEALEAGETELEVTFTFSDKELKQIKELYPNQELTIAEEAQILKVTIASAEDITTTDLETIDITPTFDVSKITTEVNGTGQITVAPIGGVSEIKGTFKAHGHDESIIKVEESGKWTALSAGKTTFVLDFELSEETRKEIQEKHPDKELIKTAIAQIVEVEVTAEKQIRSIDLNTGFDTQSITALVGDTGKLNANPIEGIENKGGSFYPDADTSDIITVDEQGNWIAQKAGTTTLFVAHIPSDQTIAAVAASFPEGTEVAFPSILAYEKIEVTITDPVVVKPTGDSGQKPVGELPKTGEEDGAMLLSLGILSSGTALAVMNDRKKRMNKI